MTYPKMSAFEQENNVIDLRASRSDSVSSDEEKCSGKNELGLLFKGMNKHD